MEQAFGTDPCFPGNPSLRPVQSRTTNAGVEQLLASDHMRISANYFENRFRDIISFAYDPASTDGCPFGKGTSFNTDLSRARGVNLSVESRPAHWLTIAASYSYDHTRVLKSPNAFDPVQKPGNRLIRRPVHSGNITLNAALRRMNWNFAGYFSGSRTDSDFLSFVVGDKCFGPCLTRNPGYARFDLAASYALGHGVSLLGRVANLFDKQYQEALGFPALGRDVRVGLKYTFHRE
jgi:vitamin B12 transporter